MLNGSADDLRGRKGLYALPTRGITVWALRVVVCPKALQTSAVLQPDRREAVLSYLLQQVCLDLLLLHRTDSHRAGAWKGEGPRPPERIGYSPADGLSAEPRMGCDVSDSLGGAFPNKVHATLEIRACRLNSSAPLHGV